MRWALEYTSYIDELGEVSFGIYKLVELGEVSFGMFNLGELGGSWKSPIFVPSKLQEMETKKLNRGIIV